MTGREKIVQASVYWTRGNIFQNQFYNKTRVLKSSARLSSIVQIQVVQLVRSIEFDFVRLPN